MLKNGFLRQLLIFVVAWVVLFVRLNACEPGWGKMAYVLQPDRLSDSRKAFLDQIANSDREFVVLERTFNGNDSEALKKEELDYMRSKMLGRKIVAYFSIGEAEVYRSYWDKSWDADNDGKPDQGAPLFLKDENPNWKGNYKVAYWDKNWQAIMLNILNKILEQSFDGVYLDIVDGFQYFEYEGEGQGWLEHKLNPETQQTYRKDMIDWITLIAQEARGQREGFLIIPQNGSQLLDDKSYRETVDGIGIESLYTASSGPKPRDDVQYRLSYINKLSEMDKPVYLVEYTKKDELKIFAEEQAAQKGFYLLLTKKRLGSMGVAFDL
ncbi:MAG: MJ1477/TM1410 family putative glycoside hydrolase [Verrucomicrobiota bacterium]